MSEWSGARGTPLQQAHGMQRRSIYRPQRIGGGLSRPARPPGAALCARCRVALDERLSLVRSLWRGEGRRAAQRQCELFLFPPTHPVCGIEPSLLGFSTHTQHPPRLFYADCNNTSGVGVPGLRMMGAISQQRYRSVGRYCGCGQRHVRIFCVFNGDGQDR